MKNILVLLLVGLVLVSGCTQQTSQPKQTESGTERDYLEENTKIFLALNIVGFEPLVDSTKDRVLIRLEIPENYSTQASVMAAISSAAAVTKSDEIVVQVYRNDKKLEEVKTKRQDVLDFINNKTSIDDFLSGLDWKKL